MVKNDNNEKDNYKITKIIIMIIIIIIIILLLLTSCNSKLWGRIGNLFTNEREVIIDGSNEKEIILNRELRFDRKYYEMYLNADDGKITFHYRHLHPHILTCTTSNSDIATCYVKDDYVVIIPKDTGSITITLDTETNGKIYRAKTKVKIKDGEAFIKLSSKFGTVNLKGNNTKYIGYTLVNLKDKISVKSTNENIASVVVKDGYIIVTGKKTGKVTIIIAVTHNGKTYTENYTLEVIERSPTTSNNKSYHNKNGDSSLKKLTSSKNGNVKLKDGTYHYYLSVSNSTSKITLDAVPNNKKAKVQYKFNGKTVESLEDLKLKVGNNELEIVVTSENGNKTTYYVTINRQAKPKKSKNNYLKDLTVSKGKLTPSFKENINDYYVSVDSSVKDIDINATLKDSKSKVKYRFNGQVVDDLQDLPLEFGKNKIEIVVTSESGDERTYTVTVEKEKSNNNYLKDLKVADGLKLNEKFNKSKSDYTLDVPFDQDSVTLDAFKDDDKSTVKYKYNGKEVDSLENLDVLTGTDSLVEVTVTSESGNTRTYTVTIHKHIRTIKFDNTKYSLYVNNTNTIIYEVYEDGKKLADKDYDLKDISIEWNDTYNGVLEIHKGHITIVPNNDMKDLNRELTIKYHDDYALDKTLVEFLSVKYFVNGLTDYDMTITSDNNTQNVIIDNNIFNEDVTIKETDYGIRVYVSGNEDVYIDLYFDRNDIDIKSVSGSNSLAALVEAAKTGDFNINVKASVYGEEIADFDITLHVIRRYILTLDPKDGRFNDFDTNPYVIEIDSDDLDSDGKFDLTDYFNGYMMKDCLKYPLEAFEDENGTIYNLDNPKIIIDRDIVLSAIYSSKAINEPVVTEKNVYLSEVDLFHNEEYFNKYHKDKIIYPTAHGSYIMYFKNDTLSDINIKSITLEEETICVADKGCLNMGYIIKDPNKYYLGNNNNYTILNSDPNTTKNDNLTKQVIPAPISLAKGQTAEISLLWEWVSKDDELDTMIGNMASNNINDIYGLTVSIQYETVETECDPTGEINP